MLFHTFQCCPLPQTPPGLDFLFVLCHLRPNSSSQKPNLDRLFAQKWAFLVDDDCFMVLGAKKRASHEKHSMNSIKPKELE